ncbi:MAG: hypothetical protein LR000_02755 [Candidatus Pacebacteria bacterium]|nr:hypothetical protein [Candidatus Paceibacterota bacterium]
MKKEPKSLFEYYEFTSKDLKKYPTISRILRELTEERIRKEIKIIQKTRLSLRLQKWIKEYEKVGKRNDFIWKWLYRMFKVVHLPGVPLKYQNTLAETKVLLTLFIVLLDDTADKFQKTSFLEKLLKISSSTSVKFQNCSSKEREYFNFVFRLWKYIKKEIKNYPNYKLIKNIFSYDLAQVLNSIKYSCIINKNPFLINKAEFWQFLPYNMVSFVYSDLDLMCFSKLSYQEIGRIREIVYYAQKMARIGNWISTWEREICENDFTGGIFAYALSENIITIKELKKKNKLEIVQKVKKAKIEKKLLIEWEKFFLKIKAVKGFNADKKDFLKSLKKLLIFHLISKGLK